MLRTAPARVTSPAVIVVIERIDRARLAALARARALSRDVRAVHVETGRIETMRIRERWRRRDDGVALDVLAPGPARARVIDHVREIAARVDGPVVVVVPTVIPPLRVFYPFVNWDGLRLARDLGRLGFAVVTAPYSA